MDTCNNLNTNCRIPLDEFMILSSYFKMTRLRRRCSLDDCQNLATGFLDIGAKRFYVCESCIQKIIETSIKLFDYDVL